MMRARVILAALVLAFGGPVMADEVPLVAADQVLLNLSQAGTLLPQDMADAARVAGQNVAQMVGVQLATPQGQVTAATVPAPGRVGQIATGEVQLAMTQLAIDAGTNDMLGVMRAQRGDGSAILVTAGTTTLADIMASGVAGLTKGADGFHLTRPLVIWTDAGLRMSPDEVLLLDRSAGGFVLSFGQVTLTQATVRGDGEPNAGNADFAPFMLVAGRGSLVATGSTFADLGMPDTTLFGGLSVVSRGLLRPDRASQLVGNTFKDTRSILLQGTEGAQVTGNLVQGAHAGGIVLSGGADGVIAGNDVLVGAAKAAIRITDGTRAAAVVGNLVLRAPVNGIVVDVATQGVAIRDNIVLFSGDAGLVMRRTSCVQVQGNVIARNGATGLRMQNAGDLAITRNAILLNGGVGVEVVAQPAHGHSVIGRNVIAGNREGLRGAGIGQLSLQDNQLSAQRPRLFAGEFAQYQAAFLTAVEQQGQTNFSIGPTTATTATCEGE
jgi:Right handed beta helix region